MAEEQSKLVELLKYPLVVFSVLVALIIAKYTLEISFGAVSEISKDGIKFSQEQKGELANLASKLNGAIAEIEQLKKNAPVAQTSSAQAQATVFQAAQTVSDQTAQLANIAAKSPTSTFQQGWIWIGNYKDGWNPTTLSVPNTGQPVAVAPAQLTPGAEYQITGNMVVRDGLPENDAKYYEARKSLGTLPRGTRVRLVAAPTGVERQFAVQYWAKIELP